MRRTPLLTVAAGVALVLALGACGDSDDEGGAADDGCTPAGSTVTVVAFDKLKFDAEAYEATAGCVDVTYTNDGSVAHTLLIEDVDDFKLSIGDEDEGSVALTAGTYRLYCDIPGHEAAGMHAELTVS